MNNGYLSKDKEHLALGQRKRREGLVRIDYMPSAIAQAVIAAKRGPHYPLNINSGILDAILTEWADLTGIKYGEVSNPKSSGAEPELSGAYARANDSGGWIERQLATYQAARRVICGAKTQSGRPCRGKSLPGKRRCKWHGGCSTGPKSDGGKLRSLANLKQNRPKS